MLEVFTVCSPRPEDYPLCEEILLEHFRKTSYKRRMVIKEYGKSTQHPHLNFVYTPFLKHPGSIHRNLKTLLPKALVKRNPRLFKVQVLYNYDGVKKYLSKEPNHELLLLRGYRFLEPDDDQRIFRNLCYAVSGKELPHPHVKPITDDDKAYQALSEAFISLNS